MCLLTLYELFTRNLPVELSNQSSWISSDGDEMTSTLALLGLLALIFLLVHRALIAHRRQNGRIYETHPRQHELASSKIYPKQAEIPRKESDILLSARRV